ncbi:hypothetical protein B0T24DRAFT_95266 [Lasiosphaeria ovina]|uniref:Uncharacterized protein n=1 Tax=Lasiosphaeria ovina TaxID=92902 RepID=A0AAE0MZ67_9PEZI|nr:hypothetical protein B0T24DRAFT_95266 [Lasiosphaeria ovina]
MCQSPCLGRGLFVRASPGVCLCASNVDARKCGVLQVIWVGQQFWKHLTRCPRNAIPGSPASLGRGLTRARGPSPANNPQNDPKFWQSTRAEPAFRAACIRIPTLNLAPMTSPLPTSPVTARWASPDEVTDPLQCANRFIL